VLIGSVPIKVLAAQVWCFRAEYPPESWTGLGERDQVAATYA
jgi:hypothetical protein